MRVCGLGERWQELETKKTVIGNFGIISAKKKGRNTLESSHATGRGNERIEEEKREGRRREERSREEDR